MLHLNGKVLFLCNLICKMVLLIVDILKTTSIDKLPSDLEGMEVTMERLLALIDDVYKYVDDVVVSRLFYIFNLFFALPLFILFSVLDFIWSYMVYIWLYS